MLGVPTKTDKINLIFDYFPNNPLTRENKLFFYNFWLIKNKNNKINKTITVSATIPPQKLRLANQTAVTVGGSK